MKTIVPVLFALACAGQSAPPVEVHAPTSASAVSLAGLARGGEAAATPERKQVRTAQISVEVEAYATFEPDLRAWLDAHGGHVAELDLHHAGGSVQWGRLVLRVPATALDAAVGWTDERASVRSLALDAVDVTAEWVDLDARLRNLRRTEDRLAELLGAGTGSLVDVLAVERELSRVRGEVEALEARLRTLDGQVTLATMTLDVSTRRPSTVTSFVEQAGETLDDSVRALATVSRGAALAAIAVTPWAIVGFGGLAGVGGVGAFAVRRRRSQGR